MILDMYTGIRYSFAMTSTAAVSEHQLNPQQERAARFGLGADNTDQSSQPLLVMAGAGTGKTTTIAHRVARLLESGVSPNGILLMTFSRRAAKEMTRRAVRVLQQNSNDRVQHRFPWAGTYHGMANKLLRLYARQVGLQPEFSILDRADAADLMDVCRQELGLSARDKRFPRKDACLEIYSMCTNRQQLLCDTVRADFPWCEGFLEELGGLFKAYVTLKQKTQSLDYDDLLLYWHAMMEEDWLAAQIGERFTHVLVDEYQDTNVLQADILKRLKPDGSGVTVVGDDAQSIYSFRAADVTNIREFASHFTTPAAIVDLELNYRSQQPILDFANVLIHQDPEAHPRSLQASRAGGATPRYVTVEDDTCQAQYVVEQILRHREEGLALKQQAVLFRNAHHSDQLEVELSRKNIPFIKYGGLKFLEAAHVKDLLCILRWSVNPRDQLAAFRTVQLLSGVGPALAKKAWDFHVLHNYRWSTLVEFEVPKGVRTSWDSLVAMLAQCAREDQRVETAIEQASRWYKPWLEHQYDDARVRWQDIQQLQLLASQFADVEQFLADLTLDPPTMSGDEAGVPLKDEDYLILSTVHSAKGQEWSTVFVLNVVDGSFPSEFSTGDDALIEEERRLLYVAATRARDHLHLVTPLKFYVPQQTRHGAKHVYGAQSRFMTEPVLATCDRRFFGQSQAREPLGEAIAQLDLPSKMRELW